MSANPHANGGLLLRDLMLPDFRDYAVATPAPGAVDAEATRIMGAVRKDGRESFVGSAWLPKSPSCRSSGLPC